MSSLEAHLDALGDDVAALVAPSDAPIARVSADWVRASPLDFYHRFVAASRPVVIVNGVTEKEWPALRRWQRNSCLRETMGDSCVTVDVTPNGHGDCVYRVHDDEYAFVLPHQRTMQFDAYLDVLEGRDQVNEDTVHYVQHQNGSFTSEYGALAADIGLDAAAGGSPFAHLAAGLFGGQAPDAVNMWIGDDRAYTALHKDPYENLFAVVVGSKQFTLLPPSDMVYLGEQRFGTARFVMDEMTRKFELAKLEAEPVWWFPPHVDRLDEDVRVFPVDAQFERPAERRSFPPWAGDFPSVKAHKIHPLRFSVEAGEVLYLPPFWYHAVGQTGDAGGAYGRTIAVNAWFDVNYESMSYAYYALMERMANAVHSKSVV